MRPNEPLIPDDGTCFRRAEEAIFLLTELLVRLGYFLNLGKSVLIPTQVIIFLGVIMNSLFLSFGIPEEKKAEIQRFENGILTQGKCR